MPRAKSHYHRQPGSNATEKQEFRGLVQELRRLAFEHRYTRSDLASELGISLPTLNQWLSGYIELARPEHWRDPSEWTGLNCSSASFSWFFLLGFLVVLSIKWATNRSPDLSIIAPGQCVARMPGTGPLRRSSVLARKKAIVGKSLVEADRFQRPWVVFVSYWLHVLKLLLRGELGWGQVAQ